MLLAFTIERDFRKTKERKDSEILMRDLKTELQEVYLRLIRNEDLLFPDIWESSISCGEIRLLESTQIRSLSNIYHDFKEMKYKKERIAEFNERIKLANAKSNLSLLDDLNFQISPLLAIYSKVQKQVINNIEELFKENSWNLKN